MFCDEITFRVKAGDGGDGVVHWRHEKYISKGGPDGGDGGKGGGVYVKGVRNINILSKLYKNRTYKAENGGNGRGVKKHGGDGKSIHIEVPVGSVVRNKNTKEEFEILKEGDEFLIAAGGNGGFGNTHFKSSTNTTPQKATKGQKGQEYEIEVELRLIADVGIIGLPNAGKSTFLNMISGSKAKIGAHPFTTLEPNLGVVNATVFADIPGLIEGAAEGVGLGHSFLRHIRRTKILLHLVSVENKDPKKAYETIRKELGKYDKELLKKKEIVVLSKIDLLDKSKVKELEDKISSEVPILHLSSIDDELIKNVLDTVTKVLSKL